MNIGIIFGQMLVLFAMMMLGYFVYKKQWVSEDAAGSLSKLVVNVFNPILVINGVLGQGGSTDMDKIGINLLFATLYFAVLILFSFILVLILRPGKSRQSICRQMVVFSNLGFMGIPVINSIYGDEAMIYLAFYLLAYNLLIYTYGASLSRKAAAEYQGTSGNRAAGWKESIKKMMNPGVAAALLAILIFAAKLEVPPPIAAFCDYMGNATIPLSMILIGISVAQVNLKKIFTDVSIYVFIIMRMVALPILLIFLVRLVLPADPVILGIFIIEMGMPVGSIISLMAKENGADAEYCTKGVVLSTLASIVTVPLICSFL